MHILVNDPLTAECLSLNLSEDFSLMPSGEAVQQILQPHRQYEEKVLKCVHPSRHHLCVGGELRSLIDECLRVVCCVLRAVYCVLCVVCCVFVCLSVR